MAGVGGKRKYPDLINQICKEKGVLARVLFTRCAGDAIKIVKEFFDEYDVFVAVGGDGTTNEIVSALAGTGKIMGLIPAGSGNALGRELGISMYASRALNELFHSLVMTIDTGCVNERRFVNICGLGFDDHIARCYAQTTLRGPVPYISCILKEFPLYVPGKYHITIDGQIWEGRAFVVTIANTSQYGNNAFIAPRAIVNDGWLDVCIMRPFPVGMAPEMALRLLNKQLDNSKYCEYFRAKSVVIEGDNLNFHIDGEPFNNNSPIEVSIDPLSLRILVPRHKVNS
jgi:YegS/Rv2252/BmrU family lipid kinase